MDMLSRIDEEIYDHIVWILERGCSEFQEKYDDDFLKVLDACMNEYLRILKDEVQPDMIFFAKVANNRHYMSRIVRSYLQGRHSTAYTQLKNILKSNDDLYVTEIAKDELFYRMRSFEKRKGLSRKDLFHIPMFKKRIIKTQRYSAPGYPCLYLGKSIYDCWEEMHRPNTETTMISCFKSQKGFNVLDLRVPTLDEFFKETEKYLQLFPFIIASGIPVRNSEDIFKPEYIIPQLLIEWIIERNNSKDQPLLGIYYTSANRNSDFYLLDHEWDNLAIPVQNAMSSEEFCPVLKSLFYCTKPTCYEYEHIQGNINATGYWDNGPERKDPEGYKDSYYMSVFSRMEELIERMTFYEVDTEELD